MLCSLFLVGSCAAVRPASVRPELKHFSGVAITASPVFNVDDLPAGQVLRPAQAIKGLYNAFNDRNAKAAASFLTDDCVYEDLLLGPATVCRGKEAFMSALSFHPAFMSSQLLGGLPFADLLPQLTIEIDSIAEGTDTVGVEWHVQVGSNAFPLGRGLSQAKVCTKTGKIQRVVDIAEAPWRVLGLFALRGEDKAEIEKLASGFGRIFGTVETFDFPGEPMGYTEKPSSTTTAFKALDSAATSFHKTAELQDSTAAAVTPTQLVQSFVAATERGDAAAALKLVTDDFLFKTYRATTDSLAAAEARLQKKFPAPTKVSDLASSHQRLCTLLAHPEPSVAAPPSPRRCTLSHPLSGPHVSYSCKGDDGAPRGEPDSSRARDRREACALRHGHFAARVRGAEGRRWPSALPGRVHQAVRPKVSLCLS